MPEPSGAVMLCCGLFVLLLAPLGPRQRSGVFLIAQAQLKLRRRDARNLNEE